MENEIERLQTSIKDTSSQIYTKLEAAEKENTANIVSQSSKIKNQLAETQQSIIADLDVEANGYFNEHIHDMFWIDGRNSWTIRVSKIE